MKPANLVSRLCVAATRPQYLWQPGRALRRAFLPAPRGETLVAMPWGLEIAVDSDEQIGRAIADHGVYDPLVTEVLWRLTERGELALDVGANVGYTASILARRLGPEGLLYAFEPHPVALRLLRRNVAQWAGSGHSSAIQVENIALSDENGTTGLQSQDGDNHTTAKLVVTGGDFQVEKRRLDDCLADDVRVGIAKIDVEGHELETLRGMCRLLERHAIRDILFEELGEFPSATHELLERAGYTLLAFEEGLAGPRVVQPGALRRKRKYDPPNSYLATVDPGRARARLAPRGWRSFGIGRHFFRA